MQVSWVRLSDWHILTSGVVSFTKDDRISVLYREGSLDWILQVGEYLYFTMVTFGRTRNPANTYNM